MQSKLLKLITICVLLIISIIGIIIPFTIDELKESKDNSVIIIISILLGFFSIISLYQNINKYSSARVYIGPNTNFSNIVDQVMLKNATNDPNAQAYQKVKSSQK